MFCRDENKNVKAHTDGKLCSNKTRLTFRNGIIRMETARDHPRLLQGNASLSRAYSGNKDFQFILGPDKDTDTLGKEESIFDWIRVLHAKIDDFNLFKDNLTIVGHERKYLNKEDYLRIICDDCVAYCCKGEKSPAGAVKLFGTLM
jgi:hypothetical protein